jgi:hypothetical protein
MINTVIVNKKWWKSKVLWFNILSIIAMMLQTGSGISIAPAEIQVTLLAIVNVLLRSITNKNITW